MQCCRKFGKGHNNFKNNIMNQKLVELTEKLSEIGTVEVIKDG